MWFTIFYIDICTSIMYFFSCSAFSDETLESPNFFDNLHLYIKGSFKLVFLTKYLHHQVTERPKLFANPSTELIDGIFFNPEVTGMKAGTIFHI